VSHLCEQLVEASDYFETSGLTEKQLSALHHFSLKGRDITFQRIRRYFGVNKDLRENNINFASRVTFIAREHKLSSQSLGSLVAQALSKWPL